MLKCIHNSITRPKYGNSIDENEDSLLEPTNFEIESNTLLKFALSDGASESYFSKEWSKLLVSNFKSKCFNRDKLPDTIKRISETWKLLATSKPLPWYAEMKAEIGSFATFLGLTVNRAKNSFELVAVGDCTLFHIRNNEIILTFPILELKEFGNNPNLIASNPRFQTEFEKTAFYASGSIEPNDLIILATDAISAWIFQQNDIGEKPWSHIQNILSNYKDDFENWLNNKRRSGEIKNDDVTLITIKFE
jgi:hypothetical protein